MTLRKTALNASYSWDIGLPFGLFGNWLFTSHLFERVAEHCHRNLESRTNAAQQAVGDPNLEIMNAKHICLAFTG